MYRKAAHKMLAKLNSSYRFRTFSSFFFANHHKNERKLNTGWLFNFFSDSIIDCKKTIYFCTSKKSIDFILLHLLWNNLLVQCCHILFQILTHAEKHTLDWIFYSKMKRSAVYFNYDFIVQVSLSSMINKQLLDVQIPKLQKDTYVMSVFLCF